MKLFKFLFSGAFMALLMLTFAFAIGRATFIENDYGAVTAKLFVYNTTWFELLLFLMVVNFTGMIFTKHLYLKSKWNILAIHLALIIIIIGAGVTRYIGSEGQMHIRNGETTNHYLSAENYLQLKFTNSEFEQSENEKIVLTTAKKNLFNEAYTVQETNINIAVSEYSPNSVEAVVPSENGSPFLTIIAGGKKGRQNIYLKEGTQKIGYDFGFSFGDTSRTDLIQIILKDGELFMRPPIVIGDTNKVQNKFEPLKIMTVQKANDFRFIVKEFVEKGELKFIPATDEMQRGSKMVKLTINGLESVLPIGKEKIFNIGSTEVSIRLGYQDLELPFSIMLNKFDIERYPGSNSPSSFASDVTVIDKMNNEEFPYRIYMNHILNYGGYRFFQSSYDPDEKGTVLSVNHDFWGTQITYIGYFLLFASLILSFFTKKTRFAGITQQLRDVHAKRKKLTLPVVVFFVSMLGAQNSFAQADVSYQDHAKLFSNLYVQSNEGRIEPLNTLANKVVVKISKKNSFNGLSADEVFLGMISNPEKWQSELILKVSEESVQKLIGISGNYATFNDFIDENGYKLKNAVDEAYNKKPALQSKHDKAIINVDERVNVFYMVLNNRVLKIFPLPNSENNKWVIPAEFHEKLGHGSKNGDLFENYLADLAEANSSGNYKNANLSLGLIQAYQKEMGSDILPSPTKAKLEIFYNETNIFKTLFPFYLSFGILLVAIFFLQTFQPKYEFKLLGKILLVILFIAFMAQTAGLALRWYISGHAPWSNGYESMIYISWATMLAGFVFRKRSSITLGVTATLAGITLLTAHMSWLNPELTNLVPVLKSYWLTIHVATITASYGFLGLGAMVAFLNLCLMVFRNKQNMLRVNLTIKELNLIVEMAITVGVVLLIIGNFLGGIWANESWGRYWGWDPKETWTLVTIMLYTFTLHLVLIPSIRNMFSFSFFAFISFGAVLMTYFGVNYYLSGLHSYAAGDPVPIPTYVYYALLVVAVVSILAAHNEFYRMKLINKTNENKPENF